MLLNVAPRPEKFQSKALNQRPRGVSNRNKALEVILSKPSNEGVFYFADDDNTYNIRLFEEVKQSFFILFSHH